MNIEILNATSAYTCKLEWTNLIMYVNLIVILYAEQLSTIFI
jgi:hypothetical protein